MGKILSVYCEGKKGSHDFDILEKVIGEFVIIKPIGGKKGANAIIEFSEKGTAKSDFYCMFRDRDFDCPVSSSEELTFDGKKTYFSYRTTIENYLFDVEMFYNFIIEAKLETKYSISNIESVKDKFIESANNIKYYQAVRHTLGKLRFPNSFETTWIKAGSGHLPLELDLPSCKTDGWALINDAISICNLTWTEANYLAELERFVTLFNDDFINNLEFLIHFQGKDFAKALTTLMIDFPLSSYYKYAKEHFDYNKYADLVELINLFEMQK